MESLQRVDSDLLLFTTTTTTTMSTADLLQTFLQVHLASDASAVTHLPFILQILTALVLERSSQLSKWNARTSSLIHSRESGARWAGLCIAKQTAVLSKNIVLQAGQGWVTVVLPMLSVRNRHYY